MPNLKYSVFPGKDIDSILNKLFNEFLISPEKEIGKCLKKTEKSILATNLDEIPFVGIDDNSLSSDKISSLQINFNKYLDKFLFTLNESKNNVDYFSIGLSQEIGNNNLDIQENKQSAALLHSL